MAAAALTTNKIAAFGDITLEDLLILQDEKDKSIFDNYTSVEAKEYLENNPYYPTKKFVIIQNNDSSSPEEKAEFPYAMYILTGERYIPFSSFNVTLKDWIDGNLSSFVKQHGHELFDQEVSEIISYARTLSAEAAPSINESPFYSDTTESLAYYLQKPGDYMFRNSKLTLPNVKIYTLEYVDKSNKHDKMPIILDTDNYYKMVKAPTNNDPTTKISEDNKEEQLDTLVNKLIGDLNINGIIPIEKATNSNLLHMYHKIFRDFDENKMNDLFTTTNIPFIVIQPYVNGDYVVYFRTQTNTMGRFGFPINDKANFTEENIFRMISNQNRKFYSNNPSSSVKEWTKHLGNFGSVTNHRHYLSILGNKEDIESCNAENTLASPSNEVIIKALLNIPENATLEQIKTYFQSTGYPTLLGAIFDKFLHGHARATTHMMCLDSFYDGKGGKWKLLLSDKIYSKLRRDRNAGAWIATTELIPIKFPSELRSKIATEVYIDQSASTRVSNKTKYFQHPHSLGTLTVPSESSIAAMPGGRRVKRYTRAHKKSSHTRAHKKSSHTRAHKKSRHTHQSKKSKRTHHKTKRHRK